MTRPVLARAWAVVAAGVAVGVAVGAVAAAGCGDAVGCGDQRAVVRERPDPVAPVAPADAGAAPTTSLDAAGAPSRPIALPPAAPIPPVPRGLPEMPEAVAAALTPERVALGRLLFFDERLSRDRWGSCASCHDPAHGFADPRPRSTTVAGTPNLRHAPSLYNAAWAPSLYWDGRGADLEGVIAAHWAGQLAGDASAVAARAHALAQIPEYRAHFARAVTRAPDARGVVTALAAFVRTLWSADSPWDRHEAGQPDAVSQDAIAGFDVFSKVGQCGLCHAPPLYTDFGFYVLEVGAGGPRDPGRGLVTQSESDRGAFRAPALRGIALTAPYFHDGSAATLDAVLDHKIAVFRGGARGARGDVRGPLARPLVLTDDQRRQLIAFLRALTPAATFEVPTLPPDPAP